MPARRWWVGGGAPDRRRTENDTLMTWLAPRPSAVADSSWSWTIFFRGAWGSRRCKCHLWLSEGTVICWDSHKPTIDEPADVFSYCCHGWRAGLVLVEQWRTNHCCCLSNLASTISWLNVFTCQILWLNIFCLLDFFFPFTICWISNTIDLLQLQRGANEQQKQGCVAS